MMGEIAARLADQVIVTTDDPYSEDPEQIIAEIMKGITINDSRFTTDPDRKTAIEKALKSAKPGDIVLIAGRGHEKYQDFKGQKVPLDDREVVRKILKGQETCG